MIPSVYDACLLYTKESLSIIARSRSAPRGIVCLQTDDTAYSANEAFCDLEEKSWRRFDSKEVQVLTPDSTIKFNGGIINYDGTNYTVTQPNHINKMCTLNAKSFITAEFISLRSLASYIAAVRRPDISYSFSIASKAANPNENDVKRLIKTIGMCKNTPELGLRFVPLDLDSVVCAIFVDEGFATNSDDSPQAGATLTLI